MHQFSKTILDQSTNLNLNVIINNCLKTICRIKQIQNVQCGVQSQHELSAVSWKVNKHEEIRHTIKTR